MNNGVLSGPALATEIDTLLQAIFDLYEQLAVCLADHERAVRAADARGVQNAVAAQQPLWGKAAALEQKRRDLAARAAAGRPDLVKAHGTQITLSTLSGLTSEAPRLKALAERVKARVESVHARLKVIRAASESLLSHMEGIARQVSGTFNHAKTYGRLGKVDAGPAVVSALDLRS